jgi:hypothetical protein
MFDPGHLDKLKKNNNIVMFTCESDGIMTRKTGKST